MPSDKLTAKLDALPDACGVYLFKDRRKKVIYVGKAINVRSRVRSYFQAAGDERVFVEHMVPKIADLDWVLVANEKEALILENNLVQQFKPRYNINLKDDKTFLSIRLDRRKPYPRLEVVRRTTEDGALYFGPYSSAAAVRETLRIVNAVFPIRKCSDRVFEGRSRPCLYFQMGRCLGCCSGKVSATAYDEMLDEAVLFLRGRNRELADRLRQKMKDAAAAREYEQAARCRDQLAAVQRTMEKQDITSARRVDRDVFAFFKEGDSMRVQALLVRAGRLANVPAFGFDTKGLSGDGAFASFLERFYAATRFIPPEVLVPVALPSRATLEEWLGERRGSRVRILTPQRGEKARLVAMAARNAESGFRAEHATKQDRRRTLETLQATLALPHLPVRMECYDISNTQGAQSVGSQVTFENGVPNKARYRRYKIRTVRGADDLASMREVVLRRLRRGVADDDLPDLIVVDGGLGQLGAACGAMEELGLDAVPIVALAKGRERGESRTEERVFIPGRAEPIVLPADSPERYLLERLRDEAHRFAITYHRKLRGRPYKHTVLDDIPGIGPARKKALVGHFGSVRAIRKATVEQLGEVAGISTATAQAIHDALRPG
ncbi:excinuclease ABC subunit UvrC [bacterium]|nr:excinuclease ABC subunit UvrC [bacterium]